MDMCIICENLVRNLMDKRAHIGQGGCPVILVGHCVGGLVLKEVCVKANFMIASAGSENTSKVEKLQIFLDSVKGVLFYATPHHGAILPDLNASSSSGFGIGPLFKDLGPLNKYTARRNEEFTLLRQKHKWKAAGVGEAHGVTLENFQGFVLHVPEASSRYEIDGVSYYTVSTDHFNITHPKDEKSGRFTQLSDFIDRIQEEDQRWHLRPMSSVPKHIVGMQALVANVANQLKTTNCRRLGIVGMGGMGKTTFADYLYTYILNRFEYASFVDDVKGQIGDKKARQHYQTFQKLILENLVHSSGRKVDYKRFGWERLKNKDVMIVLDDIEQNFHVQFTEDISFHDFSERSLIIATGRDRRPLESEDFKIHDMKSLSESDSKRLLCLKAFRIEEVPSGFEGHVRKILQKCENLPLALEVVGASLYNRGEKVWVNTYETIARAQSVGGFRSDSDRLWSVLKSSYDSLPDQEREMFLDVATFCHGMKVDEVSTAWEYMEWWSPNGWENLSDRCLTKTNQYGRITMHELLRDLGRSIACSNQPENFSMYTRADTEIASKLLPTERSKMKVLYLIASHLPDEHVLHGLRHNLHGWCNLRALWCKGAHFFDDLLECPTGDCLFPPQITYVNLRSASTVAMNEVCKIGRLRCLNLFGNIDQGIPKEIGNLRELEHLSISGYRLLTVIPAEIGQLSKLRCLRIWECERLESLPCSITKLRALQDLTIKGCRLLRIPYSLFCYLRAIGEVDCEVDGLYDVRVTNGGLQYEVSTRLSSAWTGEKLLSMRDKGGIPTRGRVRDCGEDTDLYGSLDSVAASLSECERWRMQHLRIRNVPGDIEEVSNAFMHNLSELQALEIFNCPNAAEIHFFGQHLSGLRSLYIQDLPLLEILPDALVELRALKILKLKNLPRLVRLPESIGDLQALKILKLKDLPRLVRLPESIGDLRALKILKLNGLRCLDRLPRSVGQLQALRELEMEGYECLRQPCEVAYEWNLKSLETLTLGTGWFVWGQFEVHRNRFGTAYVIGRSTSPKRRKINRFLGCEVAGEILEGAASGHFPKLKCVALVGMLNAEVFSNICRRLLALQRLEIQKSQLQELPKTVGELSALEQLEISWCQGLVKVPESVGHLRSLKLLKIVGCDELLELPKSVGLLLVLEHLEIVRCNELLGMPESVGHLPALEHLAITKCKKFTKLKGSVGQVQALERLIISGCPHLAEILHSIVDRGSVKRLTIEPKSKQMEFPEVVGQLRTLEHLDVLNWESIESLPPSIGELCGLKRLTIEGFDRIMEIPESIGQLCGLEGLTIEGCDTLLKLPQSIVQLGSLRSVAIKWCASICDLADSLGPLPALEDLEIDRNILAILDEHLGQFRSLKRLTVDTSVYDVNYERVVDVTAWPDQRALPESLGRLEALERLILKGQGDTEWMENKVRSNDDMWREYAKAVVKELPKSVGQLYELKYLEISHCEAIAELPATIGELSRLAKIVVRRCRKLEAWRPSLQHLQHLQELELVYEHPKRRFKGSILASVLQRQYLLAVAGDGRSLGEAASMIEEGKGG